MADKVKNGVAPSAKEMDEANKDGFEFSYFLYTRGNRVDVVVLVESIRSISELFLIRDMVSFLEIEWHTSLLLSMLGTLRVNMDRSSHARALIEVRPVVKLKDNIVVAMPKLAGEGFYTCNDQCPKSIDSDVVKNMKKPSQTSRGVYVGPKVGFKPVKQVYRQVSKKNNVSTSGNKKKDVKPTIEVSNSNPFDVLNSVKNDVNVERLIIEGKVTLVDDEGKPLKKVDSSGDHDSEDKIASVDNDMTNFLASNEGWLTISDRFANIAYSFFLGKRVAYPIVANYVRNTWGNYGPVLSMFSSFIGLFSFQFSSSDVLNAMLENGPWFILNNLLILKKWHRDVNTLKEVVGILPVWVKLHEVPVKAFSEDGLSAIATKLGVSVTNKKNSQTPKGILVGWKMGFKPTKQQVYQLVFKRSTASNEGKTNRNLDPTNENAESSSPSTTPIMEKIDKIENLIIDRKAILVDNEGKPLRKVDDDSEDEIASVGTQNLLELWKDSHDLDDYEYDPYDDDLYEGQEILKLFKRFVIVWIFKLEAVRRNSLLAGRSGSVFTSPLTTHCGECYSHESKSRASGVGHGEPFTVRAEQNNTVVERMTGAGKWKTMRPSVIRFSGIYSNVMRMAHESGAEDENYVQKAIIHYGVETKIPFKLRHCWEVLKDRPKWQEIALPNFLIGSGGSNGHKSSGSNSFNTESGEASINLNTNVGNNDEDEV
nr:hypothetical protein [Tanacetum cinerariifolium]